MALQLIVVGTNHAPLTIPLGGSIQVTTAPPNLDATSDSAHVIADSESAPNTHTVVLHGQSAGTANVTFTLEGVGTQTLQVAVSGLPHRPLPHK